MGVTILFTNDTCIVSCSQWRFTEISVKLLAMLIRHDCPYPVKGVQLLVNYLVHDALAIRKVSIDRNE